MSSEEKTVNSMIQQITDASILKSSLRNNPNLNEQLETVIQKIAEQNKKLDALTQEVVEKCHRAQINGLMRANNSGETN